MKRYPATSAYLAGTMLGYGASQAGVSFWLIVVACAAVLLAMKVLA